MPDRDCTITAGVFMLGLLSVITAILLWHAITTKKIPAALHAETTSHLKDTR